MKKLWMSIGALLLNGCATFDPLDIENNQTAAPSYQRNKVIECDPYSAFAHDYYNSRAKVSEVGEIGRATLKAYKGESTLSQLRLEKRLGSVLDTPEKYLGQMGSNPPLKNARFHDDYVMFLVPPKVAGLKLGQLRLVDANTMEFERLPALMAVHKEAFYEGRCYTKNRPLLIASRESVSDQGLAHFLLPEEQLTNLIASLFLDPDSHDLDALIAHYGQKFVDANTWGGWVALDIDHRRRTIFHWLFGSRLGTPSHLSGIGKTQLPYQTPDLKATTAEIDRLATGWVTLLNEFKTAVAESEKKLARILDLFDQPVVDVELYLQLAGEVSTELSEHRSWIRGARAQMLDDSDLFMTHTEIDFLTEVMNKHVSSLSHQFNELSRRYQDVFAGQGGDIDETLFLSPARVDIAGQITDPLPVRTERLAEKEVPGGLPARYTAYLATGSAPGTYTVNVNALLDLKAGMNAMANEIRHKAYAEQSCSKRITGVNTDIPSYIDGNQYVKPVDVGVLFRACATFDYYWLCGKWYKPRTCKKRKTVSTNLYKSTAHGKGSFRVEKNGNDVSVGYHYHICLHGFLCKNGGESVPSLLELMAKKPALAIMMQENGVAFRVASLRKGLQSGGDYLAAHVQTGDLSPATALALLQKIKQKQEKR